MPQQRTRLLAPVARLGPAFVAAIAYVDPGNIATNTTAGAQYGFGLLWVVVLAVVVAGPVQYLSAKLGAVTGSSLPQLMAQRLGTRARIAYWVQAEAVTIATDLAEVVGAAIALHLLFGMHMVAAALLSAAVGALLLVLRDQLGERALQVVCIAGLATIGGAFLLGVLLGGRTGNLDLTPQLHSQQMVLLAAGIVGATVMPHAIYLHSALTAGRGTQRLGERLRANRIDVTVAMAFAGLVNISMLVLGATALFGHQDPDFGALARTLGERAGDGARLALLIALLVSGITSTAVGTHAGEIVMAGLLQRRISPLLRRAITVVPAVVLLAVGVGPVELLVLSQVALALGLPFALIPLARLTGSVTVMGDWRSCGPLRVLAWASVALVVTLDLALIAGSWAGLG